MNHSQSKAKEPPPQTCANYRVNILSVVFFLGTLCAVNTFAPNLSKIYLTIISLLSALIPLWYYDLVIVKVYKRESTELLDTLTKGDPQRLLTKLIGLYGTFAIIFICYYLLYLFSAATHLKVFFDFLILCAPVAAIICFFYFRAIDRRQIDPYDEYWHIGNLLTGQIENIDKRIIFEYCRSWFIKAFFTPYVFVILVKYTQILIHFDWNNLTFFSLYTLLINLFYTIDIFFGVLGYTLTCRLTDTHIRSTEPTLLGWLVCLVCYGSFHAYFGIGLLNYSDGFNWYHWFAFQPMPYYFYGTVIIFLSGVYGLATVAIGYRMSNLTYRGLITSGPYYYSKHPAYLCKVLSWWLISLPFFSTVSPQEAVKHTLALCGISFIYFMRAKTEENHLSNYPEYVAYANWINRHGALSFIFKRFPSLQYSEEKAKKWGSVVWFNKKPIKRGS